MHKLFKALMGGAISALGASSAAYADDDKWNTNGASLSAWPAWCSRPNVQFSPLGMIFVLEATPCGGTVPKLTINQVSPPNGDPIDLDQRFADMLQFVDSPAGEATQLASARQQFGSCIQLEHAVNRNALPGLRAYEASSVHKCERYAIPADTRSLNILVGSANGAAWIMSFDHPGASLTSEQEVLLRRTASELAGMN